MYFEVCISYKFQDCDVTTSPAPDAVAYAALLRNELLGAEIETVPDPHTDDRRHAILSQDSHNLFRVGIMMIQNDFFLYILHRSHTEWSDFY